MRGLLRGFGILLLSLLAVAAIPVRAQAPDPAVQQIQNFYAALTDTMKQGQSLGIEGRYKKLKPAVDAVYNFRLAAAYSCGPAWANFSDTDKAALIAAFERMTVASYARNFASFGGEQFTVEPTPKTHGEDKIVESKIVPAHDPPVPMNYRMRLDAGTWKIIDVYLNGSISQIATRRADYASTIAAEGAQGLVRKLNAISDKLMAP